MENARGTGLFARKFVSIHNNLAGSTVYANLVHFAGLVREPDFLKMKTFCERGRATRSFSHKTIMAQLLKSLFVDPEALARASQKTDEIQACAREHDLEPSQAAAFLAKLITRGYVCVVQGASSHGISETRKRKRIVSEGESGCESEGEGQEQVRENLDVKVLRGTLDGQDAFLFPKTWHEDGVSVKEGIWFYALVDLQDDDALVLKGSQRIFYNFLFEGDGRAPVLMRSNHTQTFKPREIMSRARSTRGSNARGRLWKPVDVRDVAFYDCDKKLVVSHAIGAPEYVRARQRIRARDFLETIIQRGLGHHTEAWRTYLENPKSMLEQVQFRPLVPSVQGVCGGCGQQKRLTVKMHTSVDDRALLNEDMCLLGSFCARHLEHAPQLAAFSVHNRSEGLDTQALLCAAHAVIHGDEESE